MIIKVQEDIFQYEHKVWGNFTKRQLLFVVVALVLVSLIFLGVFWNTNDPNISVVLSSSVGVAVLFAARMEKDGQHFEQILLIRLREKFRYKQKRKFVMSNLYEDLQTNQKEYEAYAEFKKQEQKQKNEKESHFARLVSLVQKGHRSK